MLNVGLIGCGHISETYFRSQDYFNNINITVCADLNIETAKKCAKEYNIVSKNVDELLNDKNIDIVLNLTNPTSHYQTIKNTLLAGKHSYCEKPLSITFDQGKELVDLAKKNKLYLGNAPDTFLGGGGQLSRKFIDEGKIGNVILGQFIFGFPGVETFHHNPDSWYQEGGGPVRDMGPYFFTMLVHLLGPAKNVRGRGIKIKDHRVIETGPRKNEKINVETPTSYMASLEFHNGTIIQFLLSFDIINHQQNHMELYGTKGSIIVPDPNMFGGPVMISNDQGGLWKEYSTEEMFIGKTNIFNHSGRSNEASKQSNYRGVGLSEMIKAIENKKINRCNGELALHVLDIIESIINASKNANQIDLRTTCLKPIPLTEEEISLIIK